MAQIKRSDEVTRVVGTVVNQAMVKNITVQSGIILIGVLQSTGAPFQRAFPNFTAAQQWLTSGAAADVDVTRVESVTFVA